MGCLPEGTVTEDNAWRYEINHDGVRLEMIKRNGETTLFLLRGSLLDQQFPNTDAHEGISSL